MSVVPLLLSVTFTCKIISSVTTTTTMATAGGADDVTSICSVCLEPYKGRNPKLLPCFHTFCLPCLKDLEKHHAASLKTEVCNDDDGDKKVALTFPCPSCRTVTTVPPGGVSQFQTNFYLNHETVICEVCEQGQEAMYSCTDCGHNMCAQCQRWHDKFTSSHQVRPLTSSCQQSVQSSIDPAYKATIEQHLKALDASLMTMREEEETLQREMKAVADVISRRADDLKALVIEAEERGQKALAEVAERIEKQIQDDVVTNREKYSRIWHLSEQESREGKNIISLNDVQALLSDDDLRYCQQRKRGRNQYLIPEFDDSAIDMKAVEAYVGSVCDGTQLPTETNSYRLTVPACGEDESVIKTESEVHVKSLRSDLVQLESEMADVKGKLTAMQAFIDNWCATSTEKTSNEVLEKDLGILKTKLCYVEEDKLQKERDIGTVQKGLETLKRNISTITEVFADIKQEVRNIRGSNSNIQKDIDKIQHETAAMNRQNERVQKDFVALSRDLLNVKGKCSTMVAFYATLRSDASFPSRRRIVMDDCLTNVGQAYNPRNGIFTAPVGDIVRLRELMSKGQNFSWRLREPADSLSRHHRNVKKAKLVELYLHLLAEL